METQGRAQGCWGSHKLPLPSLEPQEEASGFLSCHLRLWLWTPTTDLLPFVQLWL